MSRRFSDAQFLDTHWSPAHQADRAVERSTAGAAFLGDDEPGAFEVFIPRGYEPNYPYPLVVWFHESGGNERVLHNVLPRVSERNVLGLALRGERVRRSGGFDWLGGHRPRRQARLLAGLRELRSEYHIHTERIILAGQGTGAEAAANLFWQHPDWYGGVALFDPGWTSSPNSKKLCQHSKLRGKPLLYEHPIERMGAGRELVGQLRALGLDVTYRHGQGDTLARETCRAFDRWILAAVCGVPA